MKVTANRAKCVGHARCAAVAPDVYTLDEDGYINFGLQELPDGFEPQARRGARACPERILTLEE